MSASPTDVFVEFIRGKDPKDPERVEALQKVFKLFETNYGVLNNLVCCRGCGKLGTGDVREKGCDDFDFVRCETCMDFVCYDCIPPSTNINWDDLDSGIIQNDQPCSIRCLVTSS